VFDIATRTCRGHGKSCPYVDRIVKIPISDIIQNLTLEIININYLITHTRKYSFSARLVNNWNSLPSSVVDADAICLFKARLDRFWMCQDVKYDFPADLAGIGDRSNPIQVSFQNPRVDGSHNIVLLSFLQLCDKVQWFYASKSFQPADRSVHEISRL